MSSIVAFTDVQIVSTLTGKTITLEVESSDTVDRKFSLCSTVINGSTLSPA